MKIPVSIQRFSLNDGDGIRTTVFFKGCNLRCPWCANPENLEPEVKYYIDSNMCGGDSCRFVNICPYLQKKRLTMNRDFGCPVNAVHFFGSYLTEEEILEEILKDTIYYGDDGGITFSGGEPLLYFEPLKKICKELKICGINIAFETSLFCPAKCVEILKMFADTIYVDVKLLNKERCRNVLKGDVNVFFYNLERLRNLHESIVFRVPLIKSQTGSRDNLQQILEITKEFEPKCIEFCNVHNLAALKYRKLGLKFNTYQPYEKFELDEIKAYYESHGIEVTVLSL